MTDTLRAGAIPAAQMPSKDQQKAGALGDRLGGVSVNPMAKPARQRETLHNRAIYRYHPMFAGQDFAWHYGDDDASHLPATVEGGDVHVLGNGAVMIGMGERTTPMAVEILAGALLRAGQVSKVIAVELPRYPYLDPHLRSWTLTAGPAGEGLTVTRNRNRWDSLAEALGVDKVTVLTTDEDMRAAEREQWDDGTNYLAVAPGVVFIERDPVS